MRDTVVVADTLVVYLHYQLLASIPNFNLYYFSSLEVDYSDSSPTDHPACLKFPYTALSLCVHSIEDNYHSSDCLYKLHNIRVDFDMSLVVQLG